jgi:hypothetical protein
MVYLLSASNYLHNNLLKFDHRTFEDPVYSVKKRSLSTLQSGLLLEEFKILTTNHS